MTISVGDKVTVQVIATGVTFAATVTALPCLYPVDDNVQLVYGWEFTSPDGGMETTIPESAVIVRKPVERKEDAPQE